MREDRERTDVERIVIAGGGIAALETALALRALAGDAVSLTFISPEREFRFRPAAPSVAFEAAPARSYDLEPIAGDLGADLHLARLEAVASQTHVVRLSNGVRLPYDSLVLTLGTRPAAAIGGALTFRDERDVPALRAVVAQVERGELDRVVFAVPSGVTWPLPAYELALFMASRARSRGTEVEITLATPETEPLAVFGSAGSRAVAAVLADRGVRFAGGSIPMAVRRDGSLELQSDGAIAADRVIAMPQLYAHRISGVPASWWGFVPTDMDGRVEGLDDVYAAGDLTVFPVKQGGLAAQQADRVAYALAGRLGRPVKHLHERRVLSARLLGAGAPVLLRAELDWRGRAAATSVSRGEEPGLGEADARSDAAKVSGLYITPYLEALDRKLAGLALTA